MKKHLEIFKNTQSSKGFTLIELLLAVSIMSIVVTVAGYGLVTIMQRSKAEAAETERRTNLNRALDFIADEIRMARSVDAGSNYTFSGSDSLCATATPQAVLHLAIPNGTGTRDVVYYVDDISSCTNSSIWLNPVVIKRVDNVSGTSITLGSSNEAVLVDAVAPPSTAPTSANCSNLSSPTFKSAKGFYTCIDNSSRGVQLFLYGKNSNDNGNNPNDIDASGNYKNTTQVTTVVFARAK